jgi:hypothetical protein
MISRLFIIPAFAVLAASAPVLAQYPSRMAQPPSQPPTLPQPVESTTSTPAPAATPAPSAAAALAPMPEIPPHHCVPPEYPGSLATNIKVKAFNADYKKYQECIQAYVAQNKAWMNKLVDINNKVVEEYNNYTAELKKQIDAAKE